MAINIIPISNIHLSDAEACFESLRAKLSDVNTLHNEMCVRLADVLERVDCATNDDKIALLRTRLSALESGLSDADKTNLRSELDLAWQMAVRFVYFDVQRQCCSLDFMCSVNAALLI